VVVIQKVDSKENIADGFTKPLVGSLFAIFASLVSDVIVSPSVSVPIGMSVAMRVGLAFGFLDSFVIVLFRDRQPSATVGG
jgi:ABC-type multidrug transport system permease subunit